MDLVLPYENECMNMLIYKLIISNTEVASVAQSVRAVIYKCLQGEATYPWFESAELEKIQRK